MISGELGFTARSNEVLSKHHSELELEDIEDLLYEAIINANSSVPRRLRRLCDLWWLKIMSERWKNEA